jgi:hypothetical protein
MAERDETARQRCLDRLRGLADLRDPEFAHSEADETLLEFIGDPEIAAAFEAVPKWYA